MADQETRKSGGGKLSRSETVTVRLDPKLRYLAELAARTQRRTLSSYIEWAIDDSLTRVLMYEGTGIDAFDARSIREESSRLWDVDEPDRFAKLALHCPSMLTHDEQVIWKLIRENGYVWRGRLNSNGERTWQTNADSLLFDRLREKWTVFIAVARGEDEKDVLPTWHETPPPDKKEGGLENEDDEIPI